MPVYLIGVLCYKSRSDYTISDHRVYTVPYARTLYTIFVSRCFPGVLLVGCHIAAWHWLSLPASTMPIQSSGFVGMAPAGEEVHFIQLIRISLYNEPHETIYRWSTLYATYWLTHFVRMSAKSFCDRHRSYGLHLSVCSVIRQELPLHFPPRELTHETHPSQV